MRELAERLRELRLAADMTVEAVAESLLVSSSKISRLETASRRALPRDVRDLCLLYRVPNDERDRLMSLAAQALEVTWYQDADIDAVYGTFIGLEQAASHMSIFHSLVIPGLMQTEEYARELLRGIRPPGQMPLDRIDEIVRVRLRRQRLLDSANPPRYHAILDEFAFRRPIGGAGVMRRQVEHIERLTAREHVKVQVVPVAAGVHPGLDGRFCVLRFADHAIRDTVYVEGLLGELFLDKEADVARYLEIFSHIATEVALGEDESRSMLTEVARDWSV